MLVYTLAHFWYTFGRFFGGQAFCYSDLVAFWSISGRMAGWTPGGFSRAALLLWSTKNSQHELAKSEFLINFDAGVVTIFVIQIVIVGWIRIGFALLVAL